MKQLGVTVAVSVIVEVSKFKKGAASTVSVVDAAVGGLEEVLGRLEQFPSFSSWQPLQKLIRLYTDTALTGISSLTLTAPHPTPSFFQSLR